MNETQKIFIGKIPSNNTPLKSDFRKWVKEHKNFMTPRILRVKQVKNYFIEFSEGEGFDNHNLIYGISIIQFKNNSFTTQHDLKLKSECFDSKRKADDYFYKLVFEINKEVLK